MTYGMLLRGLFAVVVLAVWIALSALPALAESRPALTRDLQSIVDAKVLRVALTRYDLPSFHVRGPDGALLVWAPSAGEKRTWYALPVAPDGTPSGVPRRPDPNRNQRRGYC